MSHINPDTPMQKTSAIAVAIKSHRNSFPFHPHVLNLREKSFTGLIISQLSIITAIANIQSDERSVDPAYTNEV